MKLGPSALAVALAVLASATTASAQQRATPAVDMQSMDLPPGVTLVELFRYYNPRTTDRMSARHLPMNWEQLGWRLEGSLGFISYTPFEGSRALYQCGVNEHKNQPIQDYFTSIDPNCEGQFKFDPAPIIGYVPAAQIPGTTTLYRCDTPGYEEDHFDTLSVVCEGNKPGAVLNDPLGFIFF